MGVSVSTGKVVDIVIEDHDYAARDGVRYGATPHRIASVYGRKDREQIGGLTWNVYANPEKPGQKRTMVLKDVRIFLNSLNRSLDLMKQGGIDAGMRREETDEALILTISIPKARQTT